MSEYDVFATPLAPSEVQQYVRMCTGKYNMRVEFSDRCTAPCTTNDKMMLPPLPAKWTRGDVAKFKAGILHECLHHTMGSDMLDALADTIKAKRQLNPRLMTVMNVLEDHRIERLGALEYPGDRCVFLEGSRVMYEAIIDNLKDSRKKMPDEAKPIFALLDMDMAARENWMPGAKITSDELRSLLPTECKDISAMLAANGVRSFDSLDTGMEVIRESIKIFKLLWPEQEESTASSSKSEGAEEGQSGEQKLTDAEKEAIDKISRSLHKFDKSTDSKGEMQVDYTGKMEQCEAGAKGTDVRINYGEFDPGNYQVGEQVVINYQKGEAIRGKYGSGSSYYLDGSVRAYDPASSSFAAALRRVLQARSAAHYVGGQKSGRLHKTRAYRAACPAIGNGDWNRTVFKDRAQSDVLDTAVSILVDFSGSMGGGHGEAKVAIATKCARTLNYALCRMLRMKVEFLTFSETSGGKGNVCVMTQNKAFDETITDDVMAVRFEDASLCMGNNGDGEAIQIAYQRLLQRKNKRKVLIVLSDGQPASSNGDSYTHTKATINQIQHDNLVEIYGIGIEDNTVSKFYKHNRVINNASELEQQLIAVLRDYILVNH